ncbi:hypothetical protein CERSUDRAFT_139806 [Gelatoporia subvermispora B]|uniref:Uncharacterized protein n=1 Tax=Ceriporiopsis subvermispora (strain B) TaxID=914234 RepID=M2R9B2_CERS8|nr:hypothetical protein CERSUDRAFT_139806 [Gelatoporia subvermispora B]
MKLDEHHQVPASINTFLRDYQRDGISFFWERYRQGQGGLLGDDMGLGKTIQVISFLSAIMKKRGNVRDVDRRRNHVSHLQDVSTRWKERRRLPYPNKTWPTCLIIAPSSVVGNWEREFETWGYFEVGIYTGAARAEVLNDFKLGRLDVVITSFETARMDISLLDDLAWSVVIIDEVHRVKNPKSRTTTALARFSCKVRFGLTGTAIQNDYGELWTMLDWANPGSVGTKRQWEGYVVRPLTLGQSKSATDEQHVKAALVAKILTEKLLPKFFLRRTKQIIKDQLPKKIDQVVFCPLTSVQLAVYKRILGLPAVENLTRKDELCDCGSRKARRKCCHPFDKADLFKYMSTLIKIANHLALILPAPNDTEEQVIRNRELSRLAFPQSEIPKYITSIYNPKLCGKWKVRADPSNKVLIFTKSVKLLQMLDFHLRNQNLGFVTLDGSTKSAERMPLIDRFHADPDIFVFLISTLAGGTGLNLTGANKVVIFDPNWNPAHDLQAMDRAYRFGQTRDVSVYRLLGAGSIEELIYARQIYKQQQMLVGYNASFQTRYFEGVQGEKSKQGELFGIKNIFKLHEDTLATKKAIEEASILDLDWALSNMDAKGKKASRERSSKTEWVYEAEASGSNEYGDLRGLGALLFDDEAPLVDSRDSGIQKTLNDIGVKYSHRNEDVTAESTIEGQRVRQKMEEQKKAQKKKVRAKKDSGSVHASPEAEWPPRRKHHKAPPSPKTKLRSRQMALVELGMIRSPAHLAEFAQEFGRKTPAEQADILAKADRHAKACTG